MERQGSGIVGFASAMFVANLTRTNGHEFFISNDTMKGDLDWAIAVNLNRAPEQSTKVVPKFNGRLLNAISIEFVATEFLKPLLPVFMIDSFWRLNNS